jgi:hypothetical protein
MPAEFRLVAEHGGLDIRAVPKERAQYTIAVRFFNMDKIWFRMEAADKCFQSQEMEPSGGGVVMHSLTKFIPLGCPVVGFENAKLPFLSDKMVKEE